MSISRYDDAYFDAAKKVICQVLDGIRPELMAAFGKIEFVIKDDKTVVTNLDGKLENLLKQALRAFDPLVGFLGEENGQEGSKDAYWLIDPIDGTESFIRGYSVARNQLAFVENGQAIFSLVYRFPTKDLFTARLGQGTLKNGIPIKLKAKPLSRCWVEMSIDLLDPEQYRMFKNLRPKVAGMMVTRDYLLTVEGIVDCGISSHDGGPWDYVPRALLLSEAGAQVGNFGSLTYDPSIMSVMSAHPDNFKQLQKLLSL